MSVLHVATRSAFFGLLLTCALLLSVPAPGQDNIGSTPKLDTVKFRQITDGLFARERLPPTHSDGVVFRVWDLHLGPGVRSAEFRFPGAVVMELRRGSGLVLVSGKQEIEPRLGHFLSVDEREGVAFDNSRSDDPMLIRATIISLGDGRD